MPLLIKSKNRILIPEPIPFHLARRFQALTPQEKRAFILTQSKAKSLTIKYTWAAWARDKQLWQTETPENDWESWLHLAGRGFGKTRTGAQWVIESALADPEGHIALVGRTVADVRDVMMGGKSGILKCSPPWFRPEYVPSKRRVTWPNGCIATTYSADQPNQLRGPQHTKGWGDELASWQHVDAFDQLQFGLRLGAKPQGLYTTTPRATQLIKDLVREFGTHTTYGTTYENTANLARKFIASIERKYGGTRLGLQELLGRILDDNPGALWKRSNIDRLRIRYGDIPELKRVVVAVDPAVKAPDAAKAARGELDESVAETGIIVVGLGTDDQGYVLADFSMQGAPLEWANRVNEAYGEFRADAVVGEVNNGGDLVESNIRTVNKNVAYIAVRATRGKQLRAEPVSSLYQQGRIHHVGILPDLEDQLCLAGETLIACEFGQKRIDAIRVGERVWTRQGLQRVVKAGCTQREASVIRLATTNNRYLIATMGHPVYNSNSREFVPVSMLQQGDTLEVFTCQRDREDGVGAQKGLMAQLDAWGSMAHKWNGTNDYGALIGLDTIDMQKVSCSIGQFGKMFMGQFQTLWKSITKMGISKITNWITCNWLHGQSIQPYSIVVGLIGAQSNDQSISARMFGQNESRKIMCAGTAERRSKVQICALGGVQTDVVASLEAIDTKVPVYNIEVENAHEYYANDILVHNCNWVPGDKSPDRLDALVWGLTNLMVAEGEAGGILLPTDNEAEQILSITEWAERAGSLEWY